jgi:hypothetical protein
VHLGGGNNTLDSLGLLGFLFGGFACDNVLAGGS